MEMTATKSPTDLQRRFGRSLHAQLRTSLIADIDAGRWRPGDAFPSLSELTCGFGVSAITARRVVRDLVTAGYLRTSQGARTVVMDHTQAAWSAPRLRRNIAIPFFGGQAHQVDPMRGPWTATLLAAVQQELLRHGHCSSLLPFGEGDDAAIASVREAHVDGLLIFASSHTAEAMAFRSLNLPYVLLGRPDRMVRSNYVTARFRDGGRQAARLLRERGCDRFVIMQAKGSSFGGSELITGFRETLRADHVPPERVTGLTANDVDEACGHAAMTAHLAAGGRPDGILASGDLLAAGACRACREHGRDIPGDVKVIGGTGLPQAADFTPPLSVVAYPFAAVAERAVAMLVGMLRSGERQQDAVELPVALTRRRSTGD